MFKTIFTLLTVLCLGTLSTNAFAQDGDAAEEPDPDTQVGVRLLTHFSKDLTDSGWGVGGWVIMPDIVKMGTTPLWLIGPRYAGKGYWVEVMGGGLTMMDADPVNAGYTKTLTVQSTRFQLTPKLIGSPINIFGNLQFIDVGGEHPVTEEDTMKTYLFLMMDYVLADKKALIGIETENYFNQFNPAADIENNELAKFNDIGIGPQLVLPFNGLNVIMSYQIHTHEDVENQMWIRAMHNFGGPAKAKK